MSRLLAGVVLVAACAVAAAAPVPKERKKPVPQLEGTTWSGDGVVAPTTYTFARGGVLVYSYNGQTYTSGSWKQTGVKIYWETNKRYAEFEGTVTGNEMAGKAWNVAGGRWDLKMKRDPNPSPPR
jgi:opacity protein-like surface antigen